MTDDYNAMQDKIDVLTPLALVGPWARSQEGLDDHCVFCGSEEHDYRSSSTVYFHRADCSWMRAREWLHMEDEAHRYYVPPADPDPCPVCGLQTSNDQLSAGWVGPLNTGTFAGHEAHRAAEEGLTILEYREKHRWRLSDAFPVVAAARGGIRFIKPLPLTNEFGKQIGVVDHVTDTPGGIEIAGTIGNFVTIEGVIPGLPHIVHTTDEVDQAIADHRDAVDGSRLGNGVLYIPEELTSLASDPELVEKLQAHLIDGVSIDTTEPEPNPFATMTQMYDFALTAAIASSNIFGYESRVVVDYCPVCYHAAPCDDHG